MKSQIEGLAKSGDVKRDEDLSGYLSSIIKEKDDLIKQKEYELLQAKVST
jgi:hypothetical protein